LMNFRCSSRTFSAITPSPPKHTHCTNLLNASLLLVAAWIAWFPMLSRLPSQTPMFLGAAKLGLIFFLVSTLIAACFDKPPSANDRIEVQLQKHGADRKKCRLDDDGFTIH
jgi:hypothetical protein